MLRILESQFVGNFADRFITVCDLFLRRFHQLHLNKFLRRFTRFFFDQVSEIVSREIHLLSTVAYRWKSQGFQLSGAEIFIEYSFKLFEGSLMDCLSRDKLPVVKTRAISQK